jgi:hypothetical protein
MNWVGRGVGFTHPLTGIKEGTQAVFGPTDAPVTTVWSMAHRGSARIAKDGREKETVA